MVSSNPIFKVEAINHQLCTTSHALVAMPCFSITVPRQLQNVKIAAKVKGKCTAAWAIPQLALQLTSYTPGSSYGSQRMLCDPKDTLFKFPGGTNLSFEAEFSCYLPSVEPMDLVAGVWATASGSIIAEERSIEIYQHGICQCSMQVLLTTGCTCGGS